MILSPHAEEEMRASGTTEEEVWQCLDYRTVEFKHQIKRKKW